MSGAFPAVTETLSIPKYCAEAVLVPVWDGDEFVDATAEAFPFRAVAIQLLGTTIP